MNEYVNNDARARLQAFLRGYCSAFSSQNTNRPRLSEVKEAGIGYMLSDARLSGMEMGAGHDLAAESAAEAMEWAYGPRAEVSRA